MRPKHILISACACVCACACTRTVYLPTETIRTEYRADTHIIRDTLRTADTITIDRTYWRTRTIHATDTVIRATTDTIHATDTVIRATTDTIRFSVSVPRDLTVAQRRWIGLGKIAAALLAGALLAVAVWAYRRIRRR